MNLFNNVGKGTQGIPGASILGHSQSSAAFMSELVHLALKLPSLDCVFELQTPKDSGLDYFIPAGLGEVFACWIESSPSIRYILTHGGDFTF